MYSDAFSTIFDIIRSGETEILSITFLSLKISLLATLLATIPGIIFGTILAITKFPFREFIISIFNTLLSVPTVVIGLFLYGFLSRRGIFGDFGLLYTEKAMIIGQMVLILPIIITFVYGAISAVDKRIIKNALALGADKYKIFQLLLNEAKTGISLSIIAAFGRAISEVGVSMMLGGNIAGYTRNMTTAIALEHNKGNFAIGLSLGLILFTITFSINLIMNYFRRRKKGGRKVK